MLKKIAGKLHIKTNALRHYEKEGLIKFDRLSLIDAEELYTKYEKLNKESRQRILEDISLNIGDISAYLSPLSA